MALVQVRRKTLRCQCPSKQCLRLVEIPMESAGAAPDVPLIAKNCIFFKPQPGDEMLADYGNYQAWRLVGEGRSKNTDPLLQTSVIEDGQRALPLLIPARAHA